MSFMPRARAAFIVRTGSDIRKLSDACEISGLLPKTIITSAVSKRCGPAAQKPMRS